MQVKYFNGDLEVVTTKLATLLNAQGKGRLYDASFVFKATRLYKTLETHFVEYSTARKELVNKYAEKDAEGKFVPVLKEDGTVDPDRIKLTDMNAYNRELSDLLNVEVTLELPFLLDVKDFEKNSIKLSIEDALVLDKIVQVA